MAPTLTLTSSNTTKSSGGTISFKATGLVPNYVMSFANDKWCGSSNASKSTCYLFLDTRSPTTSWGGGMVDPFPVDAQGNVTGTITIPCNISAGTHTLYLVNVYWGTPTGYEEGTGCGIYVNSLLEAQSNGVTLNILQGTPCPPTFPITFNASEGMGRVRIFANGALMLTLYTPGSSTPVYPDVLVGAMLLCYADSWGTYALPSSWGCGYGYCSGDTPKEKYVFDHWDVIGVSAQTSTANPMTLTVQSPLTIIAHFKLAQKTITANVTVTAGFPTPTTTITLLVDGQTAHTETPQVTLNTPISFTWQVDTGHQVQVKVHLENPLGVKDVSSNIVIT